MRRMMPHLALLGTAAVFEDANGNIVVDEDSLRDDASFAGDYDDYDDEYALAGDDYYDDDEDDLEFGRRSKAQRRGMRRLRQDQRRGRRRLRQDQRAASRGSVPVPVATRGPSVQGAEQTWGNTMISGDVTFAAAGTDDIVIRLQHDFLAEDLTFEGSAAGAKVHSIKFGDETVFDSSTGVPAAVFAPGSQMRKHLAGRSIKAGLDITIRVEAGNAADVVAATLTGKKPVLSSC